MRYLFGFMCVLVLGVVGCSETSGAGDVFPCTEAGIRAASAAGGGPYTFACDGPQTVVIQETIEIDNDVILDGEGNLTVDGDDAHTVFWVRPESTVELRGFTVTGSARSKSAKQAIPGPGISGITNGGTLTLTDSTVSGNSGEDAGGISNTGTLALTNSTVSGNTATGYLLGGAGGIWNFGTLKLTNSTVSRNTGPNVGGIYNFGALTLANSTVSGNMTSDPETAEARGIANREEGTEATLTVANSIIDDDCAVDTGLTTSNGYNIESPGDTCGFDQDSDKAGVTPEELNLGGLADNGGLTDTHALGADSDAIDRIPAVDCGVTTDQRGEPRPVGDGCDIGAFEVQPGD